MAYQFPTQYLYQEHSFRDPWHIGKFAARWLLAKPYIQCFESFINQHAKLKNIFKHNQNLSYTLLKKYADKSLTNKQKHALILHDWQNMLVLLSRIDPKQTLLQNQPLVLADILDDYVATFVFNPICCEEGFWSVALAQKSTNQRIYQCTFVMLNQHDLLIASMQGPKAEENVDLAKLTKVFFGLRPHYLLIQILREFAQNIGIQNIYGIPYAKQIRTRLYRNKVKFDYDAFWQDCGGQWAKNNYYQLSMHDTRKDMADIASKKRSMYKKRYAMLDTLATDIAHHINQAQDKHLAA